MGQPCGSSRSKSATSHIRNPIVGIQFESYFGFKILSGPEIYDVNLSPKVTFDEAITGPHKTYELFCTIYTNSLVADWTPHQSIFIAFTAPHHLLRLVDDLGASTAVRAGNEADPPTAITFSP